MRLKTLLLLAGVLIGLGLLTVVRYWVQRSRGPDLPFKGVTPEGIVKVEIRQSTQTVTLERVQNRWELKTPVAAPADEQAVKPLLEGLTKLAVGGVLSTRPERYDQFQVTEASGTTVQVWTPVSAKPAGRVEGPHAAFIIGKSAPEGTGVYLRYQGRNEVHLAEGLASYHLNRTVKDWRDKTILRVNIAEVESVELTQSTMTLSRGGRAKSGLTFSLVKTSDTWRVWAPERVNLGQAPGKRENGQAADAGKVDAFLATLASLDADDFIDPPQANDLAALGLSPPTLTIHLKAKTHEVTLALGTPPAPRGTPLRKDALPQIFLISNYKAEALNKTPADLIPPPLATK